MCLTEYNETETMELLKQESKEEGRQEGLQKGRQEGLQKGLQKGRQETMLLSVRNLMDSIGCPAEKAMDLLRIPNSQRASLFTLLSENQ